MICIGMSVTSRCWFGSDSKSMRTVPVGLRNEPATHLKQQTTHTHHPTTCYMETETTHIDTSSHTQEKKETHQMISKWLVVVTCTAWPNSVSHCSQLGQITVRDRYGAQMPMPHRVSSVLLTSVKKSTKVKAVLFLVKSIYQLLTLQTLTYHKNSEDTYQMHQQKRAGTGLSKSVNQQISGSEAWLEFNSNDN